MSEEKEKPSHPSNNGYCDIEGATFIPSATQPPAIEMGYAAAMRFIGDERSDEELIAEEERRKKLPPRSFTISAVPPLAPNVVWGESAPKRMLP